MHAYWIILRWTLAPHLSNKHFAFIKDESPSTIHLDNICKKPLQLTLWKLIALFCYAQSILKKSFTKLRLHPWLQFFKCILLGYLGTAMNCIASFDIDMTDSYLLSVYECGFIPSVFTASHQLTLFANCWCKLVVNNSPILKTLISNLYIWQL